MPSACAEIERGFKQFGNQGRIKLLPDILLHNNGLSCRVAIHSSYNNSPKTGHHVWVGRTCAVHGARRGRGEGSGGLLLCLAGWLALS